MKCRDGAWVGGWHRQRHERSLPAPACLSGECEAGGGGRGWPGSSGCRRSRDIRCKSIFYELKQGRHLRGLGGRRPPGKRKKERKKERKRKKEKKKKQRKKGTMNNVKLLHIKCCFFQFCNSPVALKNFKKVGPQEKVEMTPLNWNPTT